MSRTVFRESTGSGNAQGSFSKGEIMMKTRAVSPESSIASPVRTAGALTRLLLPFLMLAGMLVSVLPTPATAQGETIPENVLAASVRISTYFLVTPDNGDDPFLCTLSRNEPLEWSVGSGTIITPDGYVLTNHHVTDNGRVPRIARDYCEEQAPGGDAVVSFTQVAWLPDKRGIPETPYWTELAHDTSMEEDLAIIKLTAHLDGDDVEDDLPTVEFGDSDSLREPESLFIIGYPANAGTSRRVSEGIFSGWGDNGYGVEWIYTDATISGGNSGGTAVNGDGLFMGVPTQATFSDCRPGDTNNDGVIDEEDQGCIGLGGNYGILIPSNIAREFVEDSLDIEIPVVVPEGSDQPEPTDEPDNGGDDDGAMFGDIEFNAYDANGDPLDEFNNVVTLEGCFENLGLEDGDEGTSTWERDGDEILTSEFEWDDAWNPVACASIWVEDGVLDPGIYTVTLEANGESVTSDEVEITADEDSQAEIEIKARNADGDRESPDSDGVLAGEFDIIYVNVSFADMDEDAIWQVELYLDGDLLDSTAPEPWAGEAEGSESVRFRAEDDIFEEGDYEVLFVVDDETVSSVEFTIEG